ncbi:MAG TPA: helix-turn-helix transcriptional regulator [Actinomycetota bacterium]|nr:helix-turn-helix transcriptional regulator [Actinomycetota bacterium]
MPTTSTNRELGARIGLSHSSISRIRHGQRLPSLAVMRAIERELGWALADQLKARDRFEKDNLAYAKALARAERAAAA